MKGQQGLWCRMRGWERGNLTWVVVGCAGFFFSRGLQLVRYCCWFVVFRLNHSSPFLVIKEDSNTTSPFLCPPPFPSPHTPTQLVAGNYSFLAIVQLIIGYTIRFATLFSEEKTPCAVPICMYSCLCLWLNLA